MTALGRTGLLVVVVGLLAVLALTGSGGFGSAMADRDVSADVVPDEDALFGLRVSETSGVVGGAAFTLAEAIDNSGGQIDVDSATVTGPVSVVAAGPEHRRSRLYRPDERHAGHTHGESQRRGRADHDVQRRDRHLHHTVATLETRTERRLTTCSVDTGFRRTLHHCLVLSGGGDSSRNDHRVDPRGPTVRDRVRRRRRSQREAQFEFTSRDETPSPTRQTGHEFTHWLGEWCRASS